MTGLYEVQREIIRYCPWLLLNSITQSLPEEHSHVQERRLMEVQGL